MPRAPVVSHRSHNKAIWESAARIQGKSLTDFIEDLVTPVASAIVSSVAVADQRTDAHEKGDVR